MKIACFIPIKSNSERVPGKNFRQLCDKPLYYYIITHAIEAECFDKIFVDTNSEEIKAFCREVGVDIIERQENLTTASANGNDLLNHHLELYPNFDFYFQLFATAPFLQPASIRKAVNTLVDGESYDSVFTAIRDHSFYWYNSAPINYRPCILPRSQDMEPVFEETTGLYGISRAALNKYHCRIGARPFICEVKKFEAVDINTEDDLKIAEFIGRAYWNL